MTVCDQRQIKQVFFNKKFLSRDGIHRGGRLYAVNATNNPSPLQRSKDIERVNNC